MKHITLITDLTFGEKPAEETGLQAEQLFDGQFRTMLHIKMSPGAILKKHKAAVPITVLCLSGDGIFRAGADLEESQQLRQGSLITLEPEVEHEAEAGSGLQLLITKFKAA